MRKYSLFILFILIFLFIKTIHSQHIITVPINESRTIILTDTLNNPNLEYNKDLIDVYLEDTKIKIYGKQVGNTSLLLTNENYKKEFVIFVKKYAGYIYKTNEECLVTGEPATKDMIEYAAIECIKKNIYSEENTKLIINTQNIKLVNELNPDEETKISIPIEITGEDYIPYITSAEVIVKNQYLPSPNITYLILSNHPERIEKTHVLNQGILEINKPIQLLYHHKNLTDTPMQLITVLCNHSNKPQYVQIIRSEPLSSSDEISIGHKATTQFISRYLTQNGYIIKIEPNSYYNVIQKIFKKGETISGISYFRIIQGNKLEFKIIAKQENEVIDPISAAFINSMHPYCGIYKYPIVNKSLKFNIDKENKYLSIPIGNEDIIDLNSGKKLIGNYGVFYKINIKVKNKINTKKKIGLLFDPAGGVASGVFLINNELIKTKVINEYDEYLLKTIIINPNQIKNLFIITMPQAGSYYPVKLVIKTL